MEKIPSTWIMRIATIIKDNFTMAEILSLTNSFGAEHDIKITYQNPPKYTNKQEVANQNVSNFTPSQMILFLTYLVESKKGTSPQQINELKNEVIAKFSNAQVETTPKIEKRFSKYPDVVEVWDRSNVCLSNRQYHESVNNSRLALEKLLKQLFTNNKSLENQKSSISEFLKSKNIPNEFINLVIQHLRTYEILQNEHFKHDFTKEFRESEVKYILNTTYLLMDYIERKVK